jgi:hypothetical protein
MRGELKAFEMRLNRVEDANRSLAQENNLLWAAMDASKKIFQAETRLLLTKGEPDESMAITLRTLEQNLVSLTSLRPAAFPIDPSRRATGVAGEVASQLAAAIGLSPAQLHQVAPMPPAAGNDAANTLASMCMQLGQPGSVLAESMVTGGMAPFTLAPTPKVERRSESSSSSSPFAASLTNAAFVEQTRFKINESCKTDNKAVVGVEVIQEVQRALSVQVALSHRESGDGSCLSNQTTAESAQIQSAQMHDAQMQSAQMQSVQLQSAQLQNPQMLSCFQTSSLQQTSSLSS